MGGVLRRLHRTTKRGEACQEGTVEAVPRTGRIDDRDNRHRLDPADYPVVTHYDVPVAILDDDPVHTKRLVAGDSRLWVRIAEMKLLVVEAGQ